MTNFEDMLITSDEEVPEQAEAAPSTAVGIDRILELMLEEDTPLGDVSRLIAIEIVKLLQMMTMDTKDPATRGVRPSQKDLNDQVKAFQALQRTITEADSLSKKDVLNLDGEKFKFVMTEIIKLFGQAMTGSGIDDKVSHNVMMQFSDLVKANDEPIRIQMNKIGTGR